MPPTHRSRVLTYLSHCNKRSYLIISGARFQPHFLKDLR